MILFSTFAGAQKSARLLEKLGLGELQQKVNYIPVKSSGGLTHAGGAPEKAPGSRYRVIEGFYMGKTEVTNREYREFVHYVRDSIAHTMLAHFRDGNGAVDWNRSIDWEDPRLARLMIDPGERTGRRHEVDAGKILYVVDFSGYHELISIYPDTLVWIRDFVNSFNESFVKSYFSSAYYDDYPAVGISYKQALAFCQWKTARIREVFVPDPVLGTDIELDLPGNAEWESAASDGLDTVYLPKKNKNYLYNFGNILDGSRVTIKTYRDDGFFLTAPVGSYPPGAYGLYDMKGNVSEWTSTPREEVMNAEIKADKTGSFYVVKGGGWNSTPYYLQPAACQFFRPDETHSYIGFRYMVRVTTR